jgi:hypothetical protein
MRQMRSQKFGVTNAHQHLLRVLTHYMIPTAQRAHLLGTKVTRDRLVEDAHCLWQGPANFILEDRTDVPRLPNFDVWIELSLS